MSEGNESGAKIIMLIDDEEIDNLINRKIIEKSGLGIPRYIFNESISALEFLRTLVDSGHKRDQPVPDIIFLDINMPVIDGFQFLDFFDELPTELIGKMQIIMLSSSINPDDKSRAFDNKHVLTFLTKPLSTSGISQIKELL